MLPSGWYAWGALAVAMLGLLLAILIPYPSRYASLSDLADLTYDVIIIGAGTAGSLLAAELSQHSTLRILVVEAGGPLREGPSLQSVPGLAPINALFGGKYGDFEYAMDPQTIPLYGNAPAANPQRLLRIPRGKGVGGRCVSFHY